MRASAPVSLALILLAAGAAVALAAPLEPSRALRPAAERPASLQHQTGPGVPENIQVSLDGETQGASRPVTDFSEVHLAASPIDPEHLIGSSKFFHTPERYGFYTGVFESVDGGLSWTQSQPDGIEAYSLTSDPVNTFDHLGNGYFTLLTRGPTGLDMMKKAKDGAWSLPTVVDRSTTTDKQWIVGDMDLAETSPHAGNVYRSWTDVGNPARIVFSRTTDGNASWSRPPLELARGNLQGSIPAVGPDGTVYVIFGDTIFGDAARGSIKWVKSTDGGASFSAPALAAETVSLPFQLPNTLFRAPASLPALAVSPTSGQLFVAWADSRGGDADILLARSSDGGASWDAPRRMNDDPVDGGSDQFQPQVSVSPNGRVALAWHDRRLACPDLPWIPRAHVGRENLCIDTYMTRSYDGGQTWGANLRVSAQTWDPSINLPMVDAQTGFIGDYIGLASSLDYDYPFYPSTADLGDNPGRRQQVFVARVPAVEPPFDLVPSRLAVTPGVIEPGGRVTVTLELVNRGPQNGLAIESAVDLPAGLDFVAGSLVVTGGRGAGAWSPGTRQLIWQGAIEAGATARIQFQAEVDLALGEAALRLEAAIEDDQARRYRRHAGLVISVPPQVIFATPADGTVDVGPSTTLVLRFNEAMDPASLVITSSPALPPSFWEPAWAPNGESVSLRHAQPFVLGTRYTLRVGATDLAGAPLGRGPVPNPWSFTIEPPARVDLLLPWLGLSAERE